MTPHTRLQPWEHVEVYVFLLPVTFLKLLETPLNLLTDEKLLCVCPFVKGLLYLVVLDASKLLDEGTQGFSFSLGLFAWGQLGPVCLETKYCINLTEQTGVCVCACVFALFSNLCVRCHKRV